MRASKNFPRKNTLKNLKSLAKRNGSGQKISLGVNALFLKNPLTGVGKRALSIYGQLPQKIPEMIITFFIPYSLSPSCLECLREYGINLSNNQSENFKAIITPIWGLNLPVIREISEWWWLHFYLPLLLYRYQINIYEAPWSRGIPYLFPYRLVNFLFRLRKIFFPKKSSLDEDIKRPAMVITIHDLIPLYSLHFLEGEKGFKKKLWLRVKEIYRKFQSISYRYRLAKELQAADKIIVVSPQVYQDILHYFPIVPLSKIIFIPNGINGKNKTNKSYKKRVWNYVIKHGFSNFVGYSFSKQSSKKLLFYVGGFNPRKNLVRLLFALKILKKTNENSDQYGLVIAGKENHYFRRVLLPIVQNHPFPIIRLGYLPEIELSSFYQEAEWLLYPSLMEGFGMPPLEALAEGGRILIDKKLPINRGVGHQESFIVERFRQTFPHHMIENWWKDRVMAVNTLKVDEIVKALDKIISGSERYKTKLNSTRFWKKDSPLSWESLTTEYVDFLSAIISQQSKF